MVEVAPFALPVVLAVLAACTAVNLIAAVLLARKSLTYRLEKRLRMAEITVDQVDERGQKLASQCELWRAEAEGFRDEAQSFFGRSEKKAARVRAAESKLAHGAEPVPVTRDEIINAGRKIRAQQGL